MPTTVSPCHLNSVETVFRRFFPRHLGEKRKARTFYFTGGLPEKKIDCHPLPVLS